MLRNPAGAKPYHPARKGVSTQGIDPVPLLRVTHMGPELRQLEQVLPQAEGFQGQRLLCGASLLHALPCSGRVDGEDRGGHGVAKMREQSWDTSLAFADQ